MCEPMCDLRVSLCVTCGGDTIKKNDLPRTSLATYYFVRVMQL